MRQGVLAMPSAKVPNLHPILKMSIELHPSALHGCDEDYSIAEGGGGGVDVSGVDPDSLSACPLCGASLNIMEKSMRSHVFYQCNGRCPLLKETIKGLQDLANVSDGWNLVVLHQDLKRKEY